MAKRKFERREELGRTLRELMDESTDLKTQEALEKRSGVGQTTIGRILRADVAPSFENVRMLAEAFGPAGSRLYGQLDGADTPLHRVAPSGNVEPVTGTFRFAPLLSADQIERWCQSMESFPEEEAKDRLLCPRSCSPRTFAMRVVGESMEPRYQDDEVIFIDPEVEPKHGSTVIVRRPRVGEVLLRVLVIEGERRFLKTLNPNWPGPKILPMEADEVICGTVIGKWVAS